MVSPLGIEMRLIISLMNASARPSNQAWFPSLVIILFLLLNHHHWCQVLEGYIKEVSNDVIIDLVYNVRCVNYSVLTGIIFETLLVQLFQLLYDTVIIGIFDIVIVSLERRRWNILRRNQLFCFLFGVLDWTKLRKTDFDVREAGIFAHHEIIQVLLISMALRLVVLYRRNLIR